MDFEDEDFAGDFLALVDFDVVRAALDGLLDLLVAFEALDFVVDFEGEFELDFAVDFVLDVDFDFALAVERERFVVLLPTGSALPTAFTASLATSPAVPTILPAVRPTVLTTLPASGIGCPPLIRLLSRRSSKPLCTERAGRSRLPRAVARSVHGRWVTNRPTTEVAT